MRHLVSAPVMLSHSVFGELEAITEDISDTGVFVVIENKPILPKGAHIKLQFLKSVHPKVIFNARVVRVTNDGVGLVFVDYEYDGNRFSMGELQDIWKPQI